MADVSEGSMMGHRERWWLLAAAAAACGLAFALFVAPGPLRGRVRRAPPIVVLPPVASLERLSDKAAQRELHRKPPPPRAEDIPPPGVVPDAWQPIGLLSGRGFHVVVTGSRPKHVWVYDAKWRVLGEVKPPKGFDPEGERLAEAEWDSQGRWLAVRFWVRRSGHRFLAVVVAPPDLEPRVQLRADHSDWAWMAWSGERLLVGYPGARGNVIRSLSPTDGQVGTVFSESAAPPWLIFNALVSPDGRYLAFTRERLPDSEVHEDFTVWLLDLHTSVAMQLTREREGNSMHDIVRWEGPRTLLFYRGREVYRVALNLPVQAPKAGDRPSEDRPPSTAAPAGNGRPRQPRERG